MKDSKPLQELPLPGLREENPRDFLASLGLLRLVTYRWPELRPKLAWSAKTGCPQLTLNDRLPDDWGIILWDLLNEWKSSDCNPFGHEKIESLGPEKFRGVLLSECGKSSFHSRFYPSLAAQIPHEKSGRRSEFIIESANRSVLKGIDDLLGNTRNTPDIAADFSGTSRPREVTNTSRWHPAEFQSAAYVAADPKENKHCDRLTLNIFALLGLSFYPAVDSQRGRKTPGIRRINRVTEFSWPVWSLPVGEDELSSLLHHPAVHAENLEPSVLRAIGAYQMWRSRKFCPDGKNDYFSTARPAF
jgi:hypothetical protein